MAAPWPPQMPVVPSDNPYKLPDRLRSVNCRASGPRDAAAVAAINIGSSCRLTRLPVSLDISAGCCPAGEVPSTIPDLCGGLHTTSQPVGGPIGQARIDAGQRRYARLWAPRSSPILRIRRGQVKSWSRSRRTGSHNTLDPPGIPVPVTGRVASSGSAAWPRWAWTRSPGSRQRRDWRPA